MRGGRGIKMGRICVVWPTRARSVNDVELMVKCRMQNNTLVTSHSIATARAPNLYQHACQNVGRHTRALVGVVEECLADVAESCAADSRVVKRESNGGDRGSLQRAEISIEV
jgi:hypothetical protein